MKAAMHLAILMMTVYDYFYPRKAPTAEDFDDEEEQPTIKNTDYLLMDGEGKQRRFKSMSDSTGNQGSLYPFDSEDEEEAEEKKEEDGYLRMEDPIEGYSAQ